jgi:hypothetical protein
MVFRMNDMKSRAAVRLSARSSLLALAVAVYLIGAATRPVKRIIAASAEIARGKAAGLYVERTELTGKGGGPIHQTGSMHLSEEQMEILSKKMHKISVELDKEF